MAVVIWFRNLNTKWKLAVAFGLLEVLMVGLGLFSLAELSRVNETTVKMVKDRMPCVRLLGNLKYATSAMRRSELSYLLAVDPKERPKWDASMKQALDDILLSQKEYQSLISSDEERRNYDAFKDAWKKYLDVHQRVMKLTAENEYQAGLLAQAEGSDTYEAAAKFLQNDVDLNNKNAQEAGARAAGVYMSSRYWIIGLLSCAAVLGFVMATGIGRAISAAMTRMLIQVQQIAANDLAVDDVVVSSQDEIGRTSHALNGMKNNLSKVIQRIADTAQQLAGASEEISAGAGQAAESARNQADQTNQVATAMQEMSATVQQVSENSHKASEASQQSAQAARHGGQIAEETLVTMHSISDCTKKVAVSITELGKRSEQIGKIVSVIDDIADQTNLLALNAAIEAARAGEGGRGFAVVADEVRKLAERTTKATSEIAAMIESIQMETKSSVQAIELNGTQVLAGVEKTKDSGKALQEIIQMSERVGDMIGQNAVAAGQQSVATEDINRSISQIASLTQQSSATAEQTARACTGLSSLALDLQNLVSQFKLSTASGPTHSAWKRESTGATSAGIRRNEPPPRAQAATVAGHD